MGLGIQTGWADPTDPTYVPSGSDLLRVYNDIRRNAVRPAGRWLRYDTTLVADPSTWYNCRVSSTQYEVDAEGGHFIGTISGAADTWTIPTTGLYDLSVRERFSGLANGNHGLRVVDATTNIPYLDAYSEQPIVPLHIQVHHLFVPGIYLTAGTTINFQHRYDGFGDTRPLTLFTGSPTPTVTVRMVGEIVLHA